MFSLIITIVSIALVVALVAATMYHGGESLTQGRSKADAAAFVAGSQQVSGAAVMALAKGDVVTDIASLVTLKYLTGTPAVKGTALVLTATGSPRTVTSTVTSADVCTAINVSAGLDATTAADADAADLAGVAYGCVTATKVFTFKF